MQLSSVILNGFGGAASNLSQKKHQTFTHSNKTLYFNIKRLFTSYFHRLSRHVQIRLEYTDMYLLHRCFGSKMIETFSLFSINFV